jgi:hypothetical protein
MTSASVLSAFPSSNRYMPAKSFDPIFKALVELSPDDFSEWTCKSRAPTTIIDADIATISGAADKVLHVAHTPPFLLHLEFQAGHDSAALPQMLFATQHFASCSAYVGKWFQGKGRGKGRISICLLENRSGLVAEMARRRPRIEVLSRVES